VEAHLDTKRGALEPCGELNQTVQADFICWFSSGIKHAGRATTVDRGLCCRRMTRRSRSIASAVFINESRHTKGELEKGCPRKVKSF
jgi:hypothetical protein